VQPDETVDAIEFIYEQGWTDGLPVVPPTVAKVRAMVERSGRVADELIAELPPKGGKATCVSCSVHDVVELEGRGIPAIVLCTEVFMDSAAEHAVAYGLPAARVVAVQHPLAALPHRPSQRVQMQ